VTLPSAVTVASAAVVAVAAVGFVAVSQATEPAHHRAATPPHPTTTTHPPPPVPPSRPARHRPRRAPTPRIPVEVFNNAGIRGLAAQTSTTLGEAGWNVVGVANWYGQIPQTTVYYPIGKKGAARELAKYLHARRLRPSVAPMRFDRLTVILVHH
jgi:LytR cell envelope-related transcriptional attenuator